MPPKELPSPCQGWLVCRDKPQGHPQSRKQAEGKEREPSWVCLERARKDKGEETVWNECFSGVSQASLEEKERKKRISRGKKQWRKKYDVNWMESLNQKNQDMNEGHRRCLCTLQILPVFPYNFSQFCEISACCPVVERLSTAAPQPAQGFPAGHALPTPATEQLCPSRAPVNNPTLALLGASTFFLGAYSFSKCLRDDNQE